MGMKANLLNSRADLSASFRGIRPGDKVTYRSYAGLGRHGPEWKERTSAVVMVFNTHVVANAGGRFGTPAVIDEDNYVSHKASSRK